MNKEIKINKVKRSFIFSKECVGKSYVVHNGLLWVSVKVGTNMVGFKAGSFVLTRFFRGSSQIKKKYLMKGKGFLNKGKKAFSGSFLLFGNVNVVFSLLFLRVCFIINFFKFFFSKFGLFFESVFISYCFFGFLFNFRVFKAIDFSKFLDVLPLFLWYVQKNFRYYFIIGLPVFFKVDIFISDSRFFNKRSFFFKELFRGSLSFIHLSSYVIMQCCSAQVCSSFVSFLLEKQARHKILLDFFGLCFHKFFSLHKTNQQLQGYFLFFKGRWNGSDRSMVVSYINGVLYKKGDLSFGFSCNKGFSFCRTPFGLCGIKIFFRYLLKRKDN